MWVVWFGLFGCTTVERPTSEATPPATPAEEPLSHATAAERLLRTSMALRGKRPPLEAYDDVVADPEAIDEWIDRWLDDPAFGRTLRELHDEAWLLTSGYAPIPANGSLETVDPGPLKRSLFEAPLRTIEHVVMNDQPYTDILRVDYTMADPIVRAAWVGLDGNDVSWDEPEWRPQPWVDGRPAAGILSSSVVWMVHRSSGPNHDRGRANLISRALLCTDFLDQGLDLSDDFDLTDEASLRQTLREEPACAGCHEPLDGIASFLPFLPYFVIQESRFPFEMYQPALQSDWQQGTGRPPTYFGEPGDDIGDLARMIRSDERFWKCTARRFASYLTQRPLEEVPAEEVEVLSDAFVDSGFDAKALAREVVTSEVFLTGQPLASPHRVRPEAIDRMYDDLVGTGWWIESAEPCCIEGADTTLGRVELGHDARVGYRTLAGGVDAPFTSEASHALDPTSALVFEAYAEVMAGHAVRRMNAEGALLSLAPEEADEAAVREQLSRLYLRLFAQEHSTDDPEIDLAYQLWRQGSAGGAQPDEGWRVVLTALFQDLRMVMY